MTSPDPMLTSSVPTTPSSMFSEQPDLGLGARSEEFIVRCAAVIHVYARGDERVVALDGLDLEVGAGEFVTLVGSSGSGKSTLLRLLAGLEQPTTGSLEVAGRNIGRMNAAQREAHRREAIGYVSQQTADNLLPYLGAAANIEFPMALAGLGRSARRRRSGELLELVGLAGRGGSRPAEMSGGEQQRVAVAVAMANSPRLLLADEPTGELDSATTDELLGIFETLVTTLGTTVLAVTHDSPVASRSQRTLAIGQGRIRSEIDRRVADPWAAPSEFTAIDRRGLVQLTPTQQTRFGAPGRALIEDRGDEVVLRRAPGAGSDR